MPITFKQLSDNLDLPKDIINIIWQYYDLTNVITQITKDFLTRKLHHRIVKVLNIDAIVKEAYLALENAIESAIGIICTGQFLQEYIAISSDGFYGTGEFSEYFVFFSYISPNAYLVVDNDRENIVLYEALVRFSNGQEWSVQDTK